VINTLMKLGANVLYDREADIHVSGHGSIKELKLMISITKPKFFMPVHGEYKHLKAHTKIAESLNIKPARILIGQNGDILELTNNSFKKVESLKLSQIYVDGPETGNMEGSIIKDRNTMLANGVIIISAVISGKKLIKGIKIDSKGFSDNPDFKVLPDELDIRIKNMLIDNSSITNIEFSIKKTISNYIYKTTRRNPLLISNMIEV
jgi:ribonuclease J